MKLIVGLGNVGKEYESTRHNVGFMVIDSYLRDVSFKEKNQAMYFEQNYSGEKVIFIKPTTFMNDSGLAVRKFVDFYKINVSDILVIYDDMDFEVGTFKLKPSGSSGGHNGIKSIISNLGTENFKRVRIGISKPKGDTINYVLGKFSKPEMDEISKVIRRIADVIDDYISLDFDKLMSKYN